ncbi:FtsX-like permease family protein [Flavobacterium sp.]|uniref:ABC transporter permease n=1 Tax=Flavobacterium sp. TaxID=239 RepID=UPI0026269155|nr:FtsX-like permease family protein [Flavobacterium sp.]
MNFPLYIAKRYIFSKSKNNAINIITRIASGGIIIGAMALFIVLSVFSGLRVFSLSFSNDFDPDLKVNSKLGKSFIVSSEQEKKIKNIEGVVSYSKIIEERVMFSFNEKEYFTSLKGIDSNYSKVNKVSDKLFNGQWLKKDTYQVVIGYGISEKLSLGLFDFNNPFEVFVPKPGKGNISIENIEDAFNKTSLIPVGIYAISEELDSKYVFADLNLTQELLEYKPNQVSGIEIKTDPNVDENKIIDSINSVFNGKVEVKNRAHLNATLHKMLNTENLAIYLIFTLVIIMILFAFSGAIIMMVLDKKDNLKTLYHLGVEPKKLKSIFLYQGILSCAIAGIIGLLLGSAIVLIQQQFELIMITESLAYPVVFSFENILIVFITIMILGFLASLIASSRASKSVLD